MKIVRMDANRCQRDEGDGTILEDVDDVARRIESINHARGRSRKGNALELVIVHNLGGPAGYDWSNTQSMQLQESLGLAHGRSNRVIVPIDAEKRAASPELGHKSTSIITSRLIASDSRGLVIEGVTTGAASERASFGALIVDVGVPINPHYGSPGTDRLAQPTETDGFSTPELERAEKSDQLMALQDGADDWDRKAAEQGQLETRLRDADEIEARTEPEYALVTVVAVDAPLSKEPHRNIVRAEGRPPRTLSADDVQKFWNEVDRKMASSIEQGQDIVVSISSDEDNVLDRLPDTQMLIESRALVNMGPKDPSGDLVIISEGLDPVRSVGFLDGQNNVAVGSEVSSPLWIEDHARRHYATEQEVDALQAAARKRMATVAQDMAQRDQADTFEL